MEADPSVRRKWETREGKEPVERDTFSRGHSVTEEAKRAERVQSVASSSISQPRSGATFWRRSSKSKAPTSKTKLRQKGSILPELYGNKAANLSILEEICAELREEGIPVYVPHYLPLSHDEVKSLLMNNYPSFDKDWKAFVVIHKKDQEDDIKGLSPESKEQLRVIREGIHKAFSTSSKKGTLQKIRKKIKKKSEVQKFLGETQGLCMVRSTGREDTKEFALAGGYQSISGVKPNVEAILEAMGTVVESYFSENAFSQRLAAEQDIIAEPFIPVLLQEMIGERFEEEPAEDKIFCCGVGYTQEYGGGLLN
ncbi:MAG: hypothetical protein K940chlam7_00506 [Chlamydiae bacterium]|nr:hypothetical protein [Chlamydiota bacterium]